MTDIWSIYAACSSKIAKELVGKLLCDMQSMQVLPVSQLSIVDWDRHVMALILGSATCACFRQTSSNSH